MKVLNTVHIPLEREQCTCALTCLSNVNTFIHVANVYTFVHEVNNNVYTFIHVANNNFYTFIHVAKCLYICTWLMIKYVCTSEELWQRSKHGTFVTADYPLTRFSITLNISSNLQVNLHKVTYNFSKTN